MLFESWSRNDLRRSQLGKQTAPWNIANHRYFLGEFTFSLGFPVSVTCGSGCTISSVSLCSLCLCSLRTSPPCSSGRTQLRVWPVAEGGQTGSNFLVDTAKPGPMVLLVRATPLGHVLGARHGADRLARIISPNPQKTL